MTEEIVCTDDGRFLVRPERCDHESDVAFVRAVHAHNDAVTAAANDAFERAFRRAMRP